MKFNISVEVKEGDSPLDPNTLEGCRTATFPRVAHKILNKAIKAACWPFDVKVEVELVEEPCKKKKKKKKK